MDVVKKRELKAICKDMSMCILEDVSRSHCNLIELDVDEKFKESFIGTLEGYELTLKSALRDITNWRENNLQ